MSGREVRFLLYRHLAVKLVGGCYFHFCQVVCKKRFIDEFPMNGVETMFFYAIYATENVNLKTLYNSILVKQEKNTDRHWPIDVVVQSEGVSCVECRKLQAGFEGLPAGVPTGDHVVGHQAPQESRLGEDLLEGGDGDGFQGFVSRGEYGPGA